MNYKKWSKKHDRKERKQLRWIFVAWLLVLLQIPAAMIWTMFR